MFKYKKENSYLLHQTNEGEKGSENKNVVQPLINKLKIEKQYSFIQKEYIITQNTSKRIINNLRADIVITNPFTDETMIYIECKDTHIDLTKETEGDKGKRLTAIKQLETQMKSDKLRSKDAIGIVFNGTTYIMAKITKEYSEEDEEIIPIYKTYLSENDGFDGLLNKLPTNNELIKQWLEDNKNILEIDKDKSEFLLDNSYMIFLYIYKLYNPDKDISNYIENVKYLNGIIFKEQPEILKDTNNILDLLMSNNEAQQEYGITLLSKIPLGRFKKLSGLGYNSHIDNISAIDFFKSLSILGSNSATVALFELNKNLNNFNGTQGNLLLSSIKREKHNDVFDVQDKKGIRERERLQANNNIVILTNSNNIINQNIIIEASVSNKDIEDVIDSIILNNYKETPVGIEIDINTLFNRFFLIDSKKTTILIKAINEKLKVELAYKDKIEFVKSILDNLDSTSKVEMTNNTVTTNEEENNGLLIEKEEQIKIKEDIIQSFKKEFLRIQYNNSEKTFQETQFSFILNNNEVVTYELLKDNIFKLNKSGNAPKYIELNLIKSTSKKIIINGKDGEIIEKDIKTHHSNKPTWLDKLLISAEQQQDLYKYIQGELIITESERIKIWNGEVNSKSKVILIKIIMEYLEKYGEKKLELLDNNTNIKSITSSVTAELFKIKKEKTKTVKVKVIDRLPEIKELQDVVETEKEVISNDLQVDIVDNTEKNILLEPSNEDIFSSKRLPFVTFEVRDYNNNMKANIEEAISYEDYHNSNYLGFSISSHEYSYREYDNEPMLYSNNAYVLELLEKAKQYIRTSNEALAEEIDIIKKKYDLKKYYEDVIFPSNLIGEYFDDTKLQDENNPPIISKYGSLYKIIKPTSKNSKQRFIVLDISDNRYLKQAKEETLTLNNSMDVKIYKGVDYENTLSNVKKLKISEATLKEEIDLIFKREKIKIDKAVKLILEPIQEYKINVHNETSVRKINKQYHKAKSDKEKYIEALQIKGTSELLTERDNRLFLMSSPSLFNMSYQTTKNDSIQHSYELLVPVVLNENSINAYFDDSVTKEEKLIILDMLDEHHSRYKGISKSGSGIYNIISNNPKLLKSHLNVIENLRKKYLINLKSVDEQMLKEKISAHENYDTETNKKYALQMEIFLETENSKNMEKLENKYKDILKEYLNSKTKIININEILDIIDTLDISKEDVENKKSMNTLLTNIKKSIKKNSKLTIEEIKYKKFLINSLKIIKIDILKTLQETTNEDYKNNKNLEYRVPKKIELFNNIKLDILLTYNIEDIEDFLQTVVEEFSLDEVLYNLDVVYVDKDTQEEKKYNKIINQRGIYYINTDNPTDVSIYDKNTKMPYGCNLKNSNKSTKIRNPIINSDI
jgi:hypothetical protein